MEKCSIVFWLDKMSSTLLMQWWKKYKQYVDINILRNVSWYSCSRVVHVIIILLYIILFDYYWVYWCISM